MEIPQSITFPQECNTALASAFATLSVPLWALQFSGVIEHPYLSGPLWHAHELLFGCALAVIVGFLLTAGRTWSNRPTATGVPLMALVVLWLAARVLVLTPWGWAAALVNTAFPVSAAIALAIPFHAARNRRNYFFVGLLLVIAAAILTFHLAQLQFLTLPSWHPSCGSCTWPIYGFLSTWRCASRRRWAMSQHQLRPIL